VTVLYIMHSLVAAFLAPSTRLMSAGTGTGAGCNIRGPVVTMALCVSDIPSLTVKEVLTGVRGPPTGDDLIEGVDIVKSPPSVCKFVVANPKGSFVVVNFRSAGFWCLCWC
jgi:hypothetical protein